MGLSRSLRMVLAAWLLLVPPAVAGAQSDGLARDTVAKIEQRAYLFLPEAEGPVPLLVVLPGTGGDGREMIAMLRPAAQQYRFALLGLSPRAGQNFAAIDRFFDDYESGEPSAHEAWPKPHFGADRERLLKVLDELSARHAIDPSHVGLLGFSHGGSFALSLGLSDPQRFHTIAALSPGVLVADPVAGEGQAVFLAHGRDDKTQPFHRTACVMTAALEREGRTVAFYPFDGGHTMTRVEIAGALAHFISKGAESVDPGLLGPKPGDCPAN
ncbi:alpha/beta hydrolase [Tsuneonella mangrovi]|uniref:alpha/beta hydrolase n=1 Tax=Tsuneonella mangrovi TaxID=1982042 RepID=UPI00147222C2|nr:alpha/beta hydrolase-fold protein [Tsuneonella mangrovi]